MNYHPFLSIFRPSDIVNGKRRATCQRQRTRVCWKMPRPLQFIPTQVIDPLDLSVTEAAKVLGVARPALSALLNRRAALSPQMALRIEKAFGPKMDTLLRMQTAFEVAKVRDRERDIKVRRYVAKPSIAHEAAL
jgi:antitoxin HigA-1